ncbi:MAG: hypothetical protein ACJZ9C_02830 [Dehalococcoidia bacterium]|jgi:hypothetical protein|tara:strand:- start:711 stop:887 length:177 start_codon:yes stop_codon:yes gene_type:complete
MEKIAEYMEKLGKKIGLWDISEVGLEAIPLTILGLFGGMMTIIVLFVILSETHFKLPF